MSATPKVAAPITADHLMATTSNEALADGLVREIATLLERFVETAETGSIDLRSLPLNQLDVAGLHDRLGSGAVAVEINASGRSTARETSFPAVWWVTHFSEAGEVVADLIEICSVPEIISAPHGDAVDGLERLKRRLTFGDVKPAKAAS